MHPCVRVTGLLLALTLSGRAAAAADPPGIDPETQQLIESEQARSAFEDALERYLEPEPNGDERIDKALRLIGELVPLGAAVVPYVQAELERERPETYDYCAYLLGRLEGTEAEAALREAVDRADATAGKLGSVHKVWALWGLALHGQVDALRLLVEGQHRPVLYPIHHNVTLMKAVAIQTAPQSIPLLIEILGRPGEDDETAQIKRHAVRALGAVGDPAAVGPTLNRLLDDPALGREAADALRNAPNSAATEPLLRMLEGSDPINRRSAALALEQLQPILGERLTARLETEQDAFTRGSLYRLLVATNPDALTIFRRLWPLGDLMGRRYIVQALGAVRDPGRFDLLRKGLADDELGLSAESALTLDRIGQGEAMTVMIERLPSANLALLQLIVEVLTRHEVARAAPVILRRLEAETAEAVTDVGARVPFQRMGESLVAFEYTRALPALRRLLKRQTDPLIHESISDTILILEMIEKCGKDATRWAGAARADDLATRLAAYRWLGRRGTEPTTRVLTEAFDSVSAPSERASILRAAVHLDGPAATSWIERVLLDPEFDAVRFLPVRDEAAWWARRLGGPAMADLLRKAVARRMSRDVRPAIYFGIVAGKDALPLLSSLRTERMRYLRWNAGVEQEALDRLTRTIASERPLDDFDQPPGRLVYQ